MIVDACVHCGWCCSSSACGFGEWDGEQCKYLEYNKRGLSTCTIANQIVQDPSSQLSPAFGAGCCSNLNQIRAYYVWKFHKGVSPKIEI